MTEARIERLAMQRNRLEKGKALNDSRSWVQERRARTRQLIELGGLVQKAGLVDLLEDDRATLLGALLELAERLREDGLAEEDPVSLKARWRRRGMRAFEAESDQPVRPVKTDKLYPDTR